MISIFMAQNKILNTTLFLFLFVSCLFACSYIAISTNNDLDTFHSPKGFSIDYPKNWSSFPDSGEYLSIRSTKTFDPGYGFKPGGSSIYAGEASAKSYEEYRGWEAKNIKLIEEKEINLSQDNKNKCSKIKEFKVLIEMIPSRSEMETAMFCIVGNRSFAVVLHNWAEDGNKGLHEDVALAMMNSLQVD